jgi:hypothetical protein
VDLEMMALATIHQSDACESRFMRALAHRWLPEKAQ